MHDGAGLSDVTSPDGEVSITIFDDVEYDLLSIGNHELYLADVAYQTLYVKSNTLIVFGIFERYSLDFEAVAIATRNIY